MIRRLSLVAALLLGCGERATTGDAPDAAQPTHPTQQSSSPLELIRAQPAFAGVRAAQKTNAVLPTRLDASARMNDVAITALDVDAVAGRDDHGSLVFSSAATATDVVLIPRADGYEELRVLHDARAATTMRWRVKTPEGLSLRVRERYIEAFDGDGRVQVVGNPMFAVDHNHVERQIEVRLEGDTVVAHLDTTGLAFPIVVDPVWTTIPNAPAAGRIAYTLITTDNKALLGAPNGPPIPHIYNKATNTWTTPTTYFPTGWSSSGAAGAMLTSGLALIVNGSTTSPPGAVRFNPTTHAQTATAAPPTVCGGCAMARAGDGRVVKVNPGGSTVEVYNPTSNSWSSIAQNTGATAVALTLKDGRVLTMGVLNQAILIFNPTTGTITANGSVARMTNPRGVVLNDGKVLFTGQIGTSGAPPIGTPLYDPATGAFRYTKAISRTRNFPAMFALPNGKVLVAGGKDDTLASAYQDAEIWDPATDAWQTVDEMPEAHGFPGYGMFADGTGILAAGEAIYGNNVYAALLYRAVADGQPCGLYPIGCDAPYCTDGVCCRASNCDRGTCAAPAGAGRAAGTCSLDVGIKCASNAECTSNFCVDGVCCNAACTGQCEACNLAGTVGACTPVTGAPVAPRGACSGAGAGTACAARCNGVSRTACSYAAAGSVACGSNTCTGGSETRSGTCNGAGVCSTTSTSCGVYACGAELCKRSCVTEADCASGYYCGGDKCLAKVGLGSTCSSAAMCPSGLFCTDGVCCGVESCGEGSSCGLEASKGSCKKTPGAACTTDADCGSGFCTDGVCCNRKCDAQCEACDLPATRGTCSPVSGAPRGGRAACGGESCAALECDGAKDPTACSKLKNVGTPCAEPSCSGADLIPRSSCDAEGKCATPPAAKCGRYACDAARLACRVDCSRNEDCASGFSCVAGACSEGARCSEDGLASTSTDGKSQSCPPYRCGSAGTCLTTCVKSDDCAPGFVCGGGICAAVEAAAEDSGGCAISGRGTTNTGNTANTTGAAALAALVFALAALGARRARTSATGRTS